VHALSLVRAPIIEPGAADQIRWDDDTWIIWDVGFGEDVQSSGLLLPRAGPRRFRFECAKQLIVEHTKNTQTLTNLVIEANMPTTPPAWLTRFASPQGRTILTNTATALSCGRRAAHVFPCLKRSNAAGIGRHFHFDFAQAARDVIPRLARL
jgi:hypothetical protein